MTDGAGISAKTKVVDVVLPEDQSEGTESVVGTWFRSIGEQVNEHEPLVEITTDKVNVEIAAPASGRLSEILKREGEQVQPGDIVGRIVLEDGGMERTAGAVGTPAGTVPDRPPQSGFAERAPTSGVAPGNPPGAAAPAAGDLSPAVRKLLREHDLDASQIAGTGRGGRITHEDVQRFLREREGAAGAGVRDTQPPAGLQRRENEAPTMRSRRTPHTVMRRSIAQHMVHSLIQTAPHVTSVFEAEMSQVIAHREQHRADFESRGVKLTYTAYLVQAAVEAIKAVPEANARWHDDALEIFEDSNIGVATALGGGGLIVPVIQHAQDLDLFGIAQRLHELTGRARSGSLDPKEVQNGTFTISNHGVSGSLLAAPIVINQPQSAILGVGKLERRVVAADVNGREEIVVRPMCYVTLTIDHRVLDGFQANQFLTHFTAALNRW